MDESSFAKEKDAYLGMKEKLLQRFSGQFAGFYKGDLVGVDRDKGELISRIRREHGNIRAFIVKVTADAPSIRLPTARRRSLYDDSSRR